MVLTLSFNQFMAIILVAMLLVLLITLIVLANRIGKVGDKVGKLADDSNELVAKVRGIVDETSQAVIDNITTASTITATAIASVFVIAAEKKLEKILRRK